MRCRLFAAAIVVSLVSSAFADEAKELKLPTSMPTFAIAQAADDGTLEVTRGQPVSEQVEQTYTVKVPVTSIKDGKPVVTFRDEQRTRVVTRRHPRATSPTLRRSTTTR